MKLVSRFVGNNRYAPVVQFGKPKTKVEENIKISKQL